MQQSNQTVLPYAAVWSRALFLTRTVTWQRWSPVELFTIPSFLIVGGGYSTFSQPIGSLPSVILTVLSPLAATTAAAAFPKVYRKDNPDSRHSHACSPNMHKLQTHTRSNRLTKTRQFRWFDALSTISTPQQAWGRFVGGNWINLKNVKQS